MYFSIVIILFVGVIAYFHYVQGLLSSVISVVCAAVAAALALAYHEPLAQLAFATKMTDHGHGLMLIALFAIIYLILRIIFDSAVPGNVRVPALVDKAGGAIVGAIAGMFAMGILAIGAQLLPFGPSIGGYARYTLAGERQVQLPGARQSQDALTNEELKSDDLKDEDHQTMILPVDDFVVGFVNSLSDGGSLAGERTVKSVHPNYVDEIFFSRLGTQVGARHVAVNTAKVEGVKVQKAYAVDFLEQAEGEIAQIRNRTTLKTLTSNRDKQVVVLRISFAQGASDDDRLVRFSPGALRIVAGDTNYYPKGTMAGDVVLASRVDDYLVAMSDQAFDVAFEVDIKNALDGDKAKGFTFKKGVFFEAKRGARVDLSTLPTLGTTVEDGATGILRKATMVLTARTSGGASSSSAGSSSGSSASSTSANSASSAAAAAGPGGKPAKEQGTMGAAPIATGEPPPVGPAPVKFEKISVSNALVAPLNFGAHEDAGDVKNKSISGALKGGKLIRIEAKPADALDEFTKGEGLVTELYAPSGTKLVQVVVKPAGSDPWKWAADLGTLELVDDGDSKYQPQGALVKCTKGGKEYLAGKYDAENPVTSIEKDAAATPTEITLIYCVPEGTNLTSIAFGGKKFSDAKASVK